MKHILCTLLLLSIPAFSFADECKKCEKCEKCEKKKNCCPEDAVTISRTKENDVVIKAVAKEQYCLFQTLIHVPDKKEKGRPICMLELLKRPFDGDHHQVELLCSKFRNVRVENVVIQVRNLEAKSFDKRLGFSFKLIKGPPANPAKKALLHGTYEWKDSDRKRYFTETGTGRVWQSVDPDAKKELLKKK